MHRVRIICWLLAGGAGLVWLTGCQSLESTSFAPITARLETIPGGGAQHLVVVNTSGQVLHHYWFRAYMWDDNALVYGVGHHPDIPRRMSEMTCSFIGSGEQWEPNEVIRFKDFRVQDKEGTIYFPVSRVQIVGRCDEGRFRENLAITPSGQLQLEGAASPPASP
jgi:hypothetical protein